MLELDIATVLFQVLNFVVLLFLLYRFLFKPLRKSLDQRAKVIADTVQKARDEESEAEELRTLWEERVRQVELQAEETLRAAEAEAYEQRTALFEETRASADRLSEEMRIDLERQRHEVVVRNYDDILDTIVTLAGNVVQSVTTRRTHDDLVTNFAASVFQMPQTDVDEYRRLMAGRVPSAFVRTPVPLSPEQTKTLADTLSSLIDRRVELQVTVDPSLIAGIQVRLADRLIDNSVRQQLTRIRARVRRDLITRMGD